MRHRFSDPKTSETQQLRRVAIFAVVIALVAYSAWQRQRMPGQAATSTAHPTDRSRPAKGGELAAARTVIANQTIRDQAGRSVYQGDVDVGPTLDRINGGDRLPFFHDGVVFENRERRLPEQPPEYYYEFVHPTPGLSGPGPQRIIVGRKGETYYTPDHYRTFQRLDE